MTRKKETKEQQQKKQGGILGFLRTLVSALIIVMVVNGVLVASFVVPTGSMKNEVMPGDFLFVNRLKFNPSTPQVIPFFNIPIPYITFPGLRDPEKGDVLVFIYPGDRDQVEAEQFTYFLKRCAAVAGDTLQIIDHDVYVNGKKMADPEGVIKGGGFGIGRDLFPEKKAENWSIANYGPIVIPKEGDVIDFDEENIYDWKVFIQREGHEVSTLNGKVFVDGKEVNTYTVERDYCFGLGDNRISSSDSRFWGFIPYEDVVGTPMMVYMSFDFEANQKFDSRTGMPIPTKLTDKLTNPRFGRIGNIID